MRPDALRDQGVVLQGRAGMRGSHESDGGGFVTAGRPLHAPTWPVVAAVFATAASAAIAVGFATTLEPSAPILAVGYVLGALVTVALASTYRALRNARRRHPRFRVQRGLDRLAAVTTGAGFIAGLANAVLLATELAK